MTHDLWRDKRIALRAIQHQLTFDFRSVLILRNERLLGAFKSASDALSSSAEGYSMLLTVNRSSPSASASGLPSPSRSVLPDLIAEWCFDKTSWQGSQIKLLHSQSRHLKKSRPRLFAPDFGAKIVSRFWIFLLLVSHLHLSRGHRRKHCFQQLSFWQQTPTEPDACHAPTALLLLTLHFTCMA